MPIITDRASATAAEQAEREEVIQQATELFAALRERSPMTLREAYDLSIRMYRPVLDELAKR